MKKIFGVLCVLLFAAGIAWYVFTDGTLSLRAVKKELVRKAQDAVIENTDPDDVAALAVKAINLTQGEHGTELWRLKADWGNMRRKDNVLELEKPRFTYYMPPENKPLVIVSDKGEIMQEGQEIEFVDSVVATHADRTLHAPRITYLGKSRQLACPHGGTIEGEGYAGSASHILWRINDEMIEATGNVEVVFDNDIFTVRPEPEKNGAQPDADTSGTTTPQG